MDDSTKARLQVLELIRRWARAELNGDFDAFPDLLAPDFRGIGPVGFVLTGEQWAHRHRGDVINHEFGVIEPQVRIYGDVAVVDAVQRQRTTARGKDVNGSFRVVAVAVRASGAWTLAHLQLSGPLIDPREVPDIAR